MNKQSNTYTILYIVGIVAVVGALLLFTAMALRDRQEANANADKMKQILASVHISTEEGNVQQIFNDNIVKMMLVDNEGKVVKEVDGFDSEIFNIDVADQAKLDAAKRRLPVFVCTTDQGPKYILPMAGAGLWGPIWGYISVDDNGSTVYGAYFSHSGETPGLGAEIEKPAFQEEFVGKNLIKEDQFMPIQVVKAGTPVQGADYVDGISGGTITSKGVGAMIDNCLAPYAKFLDSLSAQN